MSNEQPKGLNKVMHHPFAMIAMRAGIKAEKGLGVTDVVKIQPIYNREPNEHEFFMLSVARTMSYLLSCCEQLEQIPVMLKTHRQTNTLQKADITRPHLISYHLENHLIRMEGLMDRLLKLLDATFHLMNDPSQCRWQTISRNRKIQASTLLPHLKSLRRMLDRHSAQRNDVVHHHSLMDDDLRRIEMFELLVRWKEVDGVIPVDHLPDLIKESTADFLRSKTGEIEALNEELSVGLLKVLDELGAYYKREDETLQARLNLITQP